MRATWTRKSQLDQGASQGLLQRARVYLVSRSMPAERPLHSLNKKENENTELATLFKDLSLKDKAK